MFPKYSGQPSKIQHLSIFHGCFADEGVFNFSAVQPGQISDSVTIFKNMLDMQISHVVSKHLKTGS